MDHFLEEMTAEKTGNYSTTRNLEPPRKKRVCAEHPQPLRWACSASSRNSQAASKDRVEIWCQGSTTIAVTCSAFLRHVRGGVHAGPVSFPWTLGNGTCPSLSHAFSMPCSSLSL